MFFTDHPEQFEPAEKSQLDAMQAIWEAEAYESIRHSDIQNTLCAHGLVLCLSSNPGHTADQAA